MIKKIVVGFHHKYPSQNYCYYVLYGKPRKSENWNFDFDTHTSHEHELK